MKKHFSFLMLFVFTTISYSQESKYSGGVSTLLGYTNPNIVPFWFRANKAGSLPLAGASASVLCNAKRDYLISRKRKLFDWGGSVDIRFNANTSIKTDFQIIESYLKGRFSIFQLKAGRSKDIMGLVDSTLSTGAFSVSGNALGIPRVELSIPNYFTLPVLWKTLAFKGNFSHGWLGNIYTEFADHGNIYSYFHQKSLYGRFGRENWRLKFFGGFNHQVFFGNERDVYGPKWTMSEFDTYQLVVLGQSTNMKGIEVSKVGNALGSVDMAFQYEFKKFRLKAYHQFFYDVGALYYLANVRDGLSGISFTNMKSGVSKKSSFRLNKMLVEFFYSMDQAGYPWSKKTKSGDEDYYNNYYYTEGWSYKGAGLGNTMIPAYHSMRSDLPHANWNYFSNRVAALHLGVDFSIKSIDFILKSSYSINQGTFATSVYGRSTGKIKMVPIYGIFPETEQYSGYLEANKKLKKGLSINLALATDIGGVYYNSFGVHFGLKRSF